MAQIDLRYAVIRILDGYVGPLGVGGRVNEPGGYAAGATTILVDGFATALTGSDTFSIAGHTTEYTVSSVVNTLGVTTSITFTPALTALVADNAVITNYTSTTVKAGAVNNGPGYSAGATVIVVSGFTGAVTTSNFVRFTGNTGIYTISAHSETLGNTTSITISPALIGSLTNAQVVTEYTKATDDTGAINQPSGYVSGVTVMDVDNFMGAVANGERFTVAGDTVEHTITAHTETLALTTQVTFTPALGSGVADNALLTFLPHRLEVDIGDGNLTYDEKRNMKYIMNRNRLNTVRLDADAPVEVKLDALWTFLKGDTDDPPTIEDAFKKRGQASDWVSSSDDLCEPYCVDLEIEYTPPCSGEKREIITIEDFRYEGFSHDLKMGMLSISGKANVVEATVVRQT